MEDREAPAPHFRDHPEGAYWSAVAPEGAPAGDESGDYTVEGSELRVMWDEGAGPLWGDDGLLPHDPEWLRPALGLSDSLVTDLLTWLGDMTARQAMPAADWRERGHLLDERGRELAERVQEEVGSRFRVRYRA